jgi:hypothetical protein
MDNSIQFPQPNSMRAADAASWYCTTVTLIPMIARKVPAHYDWLEQYDAFVECWNLKCRLRLAAAIAMYDLEITGEFFQKLPLPSAMDYLGQAYFWSRGKGGVFETALQLLGTVSEQEKRAFPGSIGEMIGLEYHGSDGVFVMTEDGWQRKET